VRIFDMDNRIFNVNGIGDDFLLETLRLVFKHGGYDHKCQSWKETPEVLILSPYPSSNAKGFSGFPGSSGLTADEILPMVLVWLNSASAKKINMTDWDRDLDHDGSNILAWRVFVGDWGKVDGVTAICAIKPAYLWYGK